MSDYSFKNLSDIDTVESPADGTTVMGFQSGTPIQMPMSAVKGSGDSGVFVINPDDSEYSTTDAAYGDKIKEALLSGKQVWVYMYSKYYSPIIAFDPTYTTKETTYIRVWPGAMPNTKGLKTNDLSFADSNSFTFVITAD